MRVLFANNYGMSSARSGWRAGVYPAHHLYGTASMASEFEIVDLPFSESGRLVRFTGLTRGRAGNLEQQWAAVRQLRPGSVIYAAQAQDVTGLGLMRRAGVLRVPIVGVVHGTAAFGRLTSAALAGFDRLIVISRMTRDALICLRVPAEQITIVPWGPDLDFPGFLPVDTGSPLPVIVATGKTGRDMGLLLRALAGTGLPARVYGDRASLERLVSIPDNVTVAPPMRAPARSGAPSTYAHTLDDLRRAGVVAIPLSERYPLHGLTEIADAIACGKPVIVTRAPYFDFDIEAIGCGWWVDHDDLDGWRSTLADAMSDPARLVEMGRRGRAWAARHWNAKLFGLGVAQVLREARSAAGPPAPTPAGAEEPRSPAGGSRGNQL